MLSVCVCIKMLQILQPGFDLHDLSLFKPGILHRYTQSTGVPVSCRSLVIPHTTSQPTASSTLPWQMLWHPGRDATSLVMIWWPQVDTIAVFFSVQYSKKNQVGKLLSKKGIGCDVYIQFLCVCVCASQMLYTQAYIMKHYTLKAHNFEPLYWNCIVCKPGLSLEKQRKINSFTAPPTHNASFK